jgi:hypothetical protein
MYVQNFFDSSGNWIAFRKDGFVYSTDGEWIGWLPWDDEDVFDPHGQYLGTVFDGNRLYYDPSKPYRGYPGYPSSPGYPGYPGHPGYAGYSPLPPGTRDLALTKVSR